MSQLHSWDVSAVNLNLTPMFVGPPLIKLPDQVIEDLATDQHYGIGNKMVCTIRDGVLSVRLALLEIVPVNHSRWLTTENRLLRLWVWRHGLKGTNLKNLQFTVEFIIGVYTILAGSTLPSYHARHIPFLLDCLKSQRKKVLDLVMPTEKICLVCPQWSHPPNTAVLWVSEEEDWGDGENIGH